MTTSDEPADPVDPHRAAPKVSFSSGDDPEVTSEPTQDEDARELQEENAETSQGQPSS